MYRHVRITREIKGGNEKNNRQLLETRSKTSWWLKGSDPSHVHENVQAPPINGTAVKQLGSS